MDTLLLGLCLLRKQAVKQPIACRNWKKPSANLPTETLPVEMDRSSQPAGCGEAEEARLKLLNEAMRAMQGVLAAAWKRYFKKQ